jgi:hypothetical protein
MMHIGKQRQGRLIYTLQGDQFQLRLPIGITHGQ